MPIVDDYLLGRSPAFPLGDTTENRTDLTLTQSAAPTGRVRGRVTNSVDGSPVADATVKLRTQSGDPARHTQTNAAGNYFIDEVVPGTYAINAAKQGFLTSTAQTFTLLDKQTLDIDISITPDTPLMNTVYGLVTNQATSIPIANARVVLTPTPGVFTNPTVAMTNNSGQYELCEISDGTQYIISAAEGFYQSGIIPVTVSGGAIVRMDVSLQQYALPQATVNGYITAQNGNPIANACVGLYLINLQGVEILQQMAFTDSSGFYIFGRAAVGTYVVKAKSEKVAAPEE